MNKIFYHNFIFIINNLMLFFSIFGIKTSFFLLLSLLLILLLNYKLVIYHILVISLLFFTRGQFYHVIFHLTMSCNYQG